MERQALAMELSRTYDIGDGRSAYFAEGSLQLVVIPEPAAALLGGCAHGAVDPDFPDGPAAPMPAASVAVARPP